MLRSIKNNDGFSLIELLIALTVFAIGLLALAGMQVTAIRGGSKSQRVTAVAALANGIVESIQARDSGDALFSGNKDLDSKTIATWPSDIQTEGYEATIVVNDDFPIVGIAEITVGVVDPVVGGGTVTVTTLKRTR